MKGRSIYFTQKELKAVRQACSEYCDIMYDGEEPYKAYARK